ncbi:ubiquinone anaerobic biosynthesis accessory factor UbiT [Pannonibacter phragmitetus]|uniref:ubiquinone anaerobic biosynthesis accessory factor UbiT n=1 Tax=Pannonibacter phragmitetus TaxID=121719 RepID=UPI000B31DC58|nr:SCP2 sterol-binding domain-containing protein [Pannonibacter phragmitetus]
MMSSGPNTSPGTSPDTPSGAGQPPSIPEMPPFLALGLRLAPAAPAAFVLTGAARQIVARHPGLMTRLGAYRHSRFALTASDVPLTFLMDLSQEPLTITLHAAPPTADARITGKLAALVGLVHGVWDGDALFFSRDLTIEGDTSAALALRNAIDDAELDLGAEIARLTGPLAGAANRVIALLQSITGVPLSRPAPMEAFR